MTPKFKMPFPMAEAIGKRRAKELRGAASPSYWAAAEARVNSAPYKRAWKRFMKALGVLE